MTTTADLDDLYNQMIDCSVDSQNDEHTQHTAHNKHDEIAENNDFNQINNELKLWQELEKLAVLQTCFLGRSVLFFFPNHKSAQFRTPELNELFAYTVGCYVSKLLGRHNPGWSFFQCCPNFEQFIIKQTHEI